MSGWKSELWLLVDTETTGLDPEHDRVVQLGVCRMEGGESLRRDFAMINPGIPIPEAASAIHGIRDEDVIGHPGFANVARHLLWDIEHAPIVAGYNLAFDAAMIGAEMQRHGFGDRWDDVWSAASTIDVLTQIKRRSVGRFWKGTGRHRLERVIERLGIRVSGRAHTADADAEAAGRILWHTRDKLPDDLDECLALLRLRAEEHAEDRRKWEAGGREKWAREKGLSGAAPNGDASQGSTGGEHA